MGRLLLLSLVAMSGAAQGATVVLDQDTSGMGSNSSGYAVLKIHSMVQTFTVGESGTLDTVSIQVRKEQNTYEDLVLSIWTAGPDGLRQDLLGTYSKSAADIDGLYSSYFEDFDVSAMNIAVSEGDVLAVALDSAAVQSFVAPGERYFWGKSYDAHAYVDGEAYGCSVLDAQSCLQQDWDFSLRTYVQVVPIPAAVWLFGSALAGLGFMRRR